MNFTSKGISTFIGAKDYEESRKFYRQLDFQEIVLDKMSHFRVNENLGFYLQDYYVKDWVNNSMIFLEVDDLDACESEIKSKSLDETYKYVRFTEIKTYRHGREFFMHDPSGVLWHFCEFHKK